MSTMPRPAKVVGCTATHAGDVSLGNLVVCRGEDARTTDLQMLTVHSKEGQRVGDGGQRQEERVGQRVERSPAVLGQVKTNRVENKVDKAVTGEEPERAL